MLRCSSAIPLNIFAESTIYTGALQEVFTAIPLNFTKEHIEEIKKLRGKVWTQTFTVQSACFRIGFIYFNFENFQHKLGGGAGLKRRSSFIQIHTFETM